MRKYLRNCESRSPLNALLRDRQDPGGDLRAAEKACGTCRNWHGVWACRPPACQRELQDLTEAGILKSHRQGRMVYYQANGESSLFPDLRGLLLKTVVSRYSGRRLKPLRTKIRSPLCTVHSHGQERSDSDIDLMVSACFPRGPRCAFAACARITWARNQSNGLLVS